MEILETFYISSQNIFTICGSLTAFYFVLVGIKSAIDIARGN